MKSSLIELKFLNNSLPNRALPRDEELDGATALLCKNSLDGFIIQALTLFSVLPGIPILRALFFKYLIFFTIRLVINLNI